MQFQSLKRGATGTFDDDALAKILQDATDAPAGAFRARGTPEVMRLIEVMTIQQARGWGVATVRLLTPSLMWSFNFAMMGHSPGVFFCRR